MRKNIRLDNAGEEMFKPFIFIIVFIVASIVVLGAWGAETAQYTGAQGNAIIGGMAYNWFDPEGGRPMSWANVTNNYVPFGVKTVHFWKTGDSNPFSLTVVRNRTAGAGWFDNAEWFKYTDFIGIEHSGVNWWIFPYTDRYAISFSTISNTHNQSQYIKGNATVVNFGLGSSNMSLSVTTEGPAVNFTQDLYGMNWYAVTLGQSIQTQIQESAESAWWNVVFQLFTFSLPDVPWPIAVLITGIIWAAIGFIAFIFVTRLLHGGG